MSLTLQHLVVQNIGILSNHEPTLGGLNINSKVSLMSTFVNFNSFCPDEFAIIVEIL